MSLRSPVETPQRTGVSRSYVVGVASARGGPGEQKQRGVSTNGPILFNSRFRVQSTRLATWDYRANGYYFVTICTKNRAPVLGEIIERAVQLSRIGNIVAAEWRDIAIRRRDVLLDEWVVMPNHLHGIVITRRDRGAVETPQRDQSTGGISDDHPLPERHHVDGMQRGVSREGVASRLLAGSLGAIIGQFKSRATKRVWRAGFRDFGWQPRFYDHIIRNDDALDRIRQYIMDNPVKWDSNEEIPENLWM